MDKQQLKQAIIDHFINEHKTADDAAKTNYEAATHEENRAENKYDTRGLEASYMAASQGKRALELQQTVNIYKALELQTFDEDDEIAMTALITLENESGTMIYFLGPRGGGTRLRVENEIVTIITAAAPLGRKLLGSMVGDEIIGAGNKTWEIAEVS